MPATHKKSPLKLINILGLVFGLNWQQKAINIPGIGAISWV